MAYVTVHSTARRVVAFRALGKPILRIFPGYNKVDAEGLDQYFQNPAAIGLFRAYLSYPDTAALEGHEEEAEASYLKNLDLNRARRMVQAQGVKIEESSKLLAEKDAIIAGLQEQLEQAGAE